jgi:hypothetical protein
MAGVIVRSAAGELPHVDRLMAVTTTPLHTELDSAGGAAAFPKK